MTDVTRIEWLIKTGNKSWSGTDTQVEIEILRDGHSLILLNLEPGDTKRLNRNEQASYSWTFQPPDDLGTGDGPFTESFPHGLNGHLQVRLIAKGDDAWEKVWINSLVYSGHEEFVVGSIDQSFWVEEVQSFFFDEDVVLSTDTSEGHPTWTLIY